MARPGTGELQDKKGSRQEKVSESKTMKKKIIPVQSDSSESSPSPEEPSTPVDSPQPPSSHSSRFRLSQRNGFKHQEEEEMKSLGQKLKNSYSKCHFTLIGVYLFYFQALEKDRKASLAVKTL